MTLLYIKYFPYVYVKFKSWNIGVLKGLFTDKYKFIHHLLTTMPMEEWVKCSSPLNTSGASGVNFVGAESDTIEVTSYLYFRCNTQQQKHNMPPYCLYGVIQVSASPGIHIRLDTKSFTLCFKPKRQQEVAKLADVATLCCMLRSLNNSRRKISEDI